MGKPKLDYIFVFAVLALVAVGLIMIFSASPTMGLKINDTYFFIKRHLFYLLLGGLALYFGLSLDLKTLKKRSGLIFAVSIFLLLLLFVPGVGKKISGATRWINLVFISFQPSEFFKFAMILYLANLLANKGAKLQDFVQGLLPVLVLIGLVLGVIILQPDLGTAIAIAGTSFVMLFAANARLAHLSLLGGVGVTLIAVLSVTSPYRLRRMVAFLDPWKDPQGSGFHIIQSLLAVGSGGFSGLGLGASKQKFFYLPQQFTDFIFAILCEELGLLGGVAVLILFIIFVVRGFRIAMNAPDSFSLLLATGLVAWLAIQALMNIMVVLGLLPTTGIPLPFISYGGTATIMNLLAVGILINISLASPLPAKRKG
ncbi:MAG: putative lipid II flippase FtsW [bacterium]